jgi:hypothetical protein
MMVGETIGKGRRKERSDERRKKGWTNLNNDPRGQKRNHPWQV